MKDYVQNPRGTALAVTNLVYRQQHSEAAAASAAIALCCAGSG